MIQEQILNKILKDKDISIITLNNLTADYFPENRNEFWFIKKHYDDFGVVPDEATFLDKFPSFDIIEVNEPTKYLLSELVKDKNKRFLAETFNKVRGKLMEADPNIDEAIIFDTQINRNFLTNLYLRIQKSFWHIPNCVGTDFKITSFYFRDTLESSVYNLNLQTLSSTIPLKSTEIFDSETSNSSISNLFFSIISKIFLIHS